jgi:hypothetical protein
LLIDDDNNIMLKAKATVFLLLAVVGQWTLFYHINNGKEYSRHLSLEAAAFQMVINGTIEMLDSQHRSSNLTLSLQQNFYQPQNQQQNLQQQPLQDKNSVPEITTSVRYIHNRNFNVTTTTMIVPPAMTKPPPRPKWVHNTTSWLPMPDSNFNVTFPVLVASLPKSGTTSIYAYFLCGGVRSVHTYCPHRNKFDPRQLRIGAVIEENVKNGNAPFQGCEDGDNERLGPVKVFSDTGYVMPEGPCYYPSISALESMYKSYPNMTILLGTRNSTKWYHSFKNWNKGGLQWLWTKYCDPMPSTPHPNAFTSFYEWHNHHIRNFAQQHPSVTLIEFQIDSSTAGSDLERATNISSSCWGKYQPK